MTGGIQAAINDSIGWVMVSHFVLYWERERIRLRREATLSRGIMRARTMRRLRELRREKWDMARLLFKCGDDCRPEARHHVGCDWERQMAVLLT